MKIIVAKDAGYCFGVRDAVDMAYDTSKKEGNVYMLGDIVHNEKVVNDLNNSGAKVVFTGRNSEILLDIEKELNNPSRTIFKCIDFAIRTCFVWNRNISIQ